MFANCVNPDSLENYILLHEAEYESELGCSWSDNALKKTLIWHFTG